MAESKNKQSNSMDSVAMLGFVLLALIVIFSALYFSIGNWNVRESIMDYKYEKQTSIDFVNQVETFRDRTYQQPHIIIGRFVLDMWGTPYKLNVFPLSSQDKLKALELSLETNIQNMTKYSKRLAYAERILQTRTNLSSNQSKRLQRIQEDSLKKVMPMRMKHNALFEQAIDLLFKIQADAFLWYFLYSIPVFLLIIIIVSRIAYQALLPPEEKKSTDTKEERFKKATLTTFSMPPEQLKKPAWFMSNKPKLAKNWRSHKFTKKCMAIWKTSGTSMLPLAEDVIAYLVAHEKTPASIHGHCAYEGGLLEHTAHVLEEAVTHGQALEWSGARLQLLLVSALAHDIGKAESFAYHSESNKWFDTLAYHDKLSGFILQSLPHFLMIPKDMREALLLSVECRHCYSDIPNNFPAFSRTLFKAVCKADDAAARKETEAAEPMLTPIYEYILEQWIPLLQSMNINGITSGTKDGLYDSEQGLCVFSVSRFLKALYLIAPKSLMGHISENAPKDKPHPIWKHIAPQLLEADLILSPVTIIPRSTRQDRLIKEEAITFTPKALAYFQILHKHGSINDAVSLNISKLPDSTLHSWNVIEGKDIHFSFSQKGDAK